jgi:hypothetical protein
MKRLFLASAIFISLTTVAYGGVSFDREDPQTYWKSHRLALLRHGGIANSLCVYGTDPDQVCANSQNYISNAFYSDANVPMESAQTGQLPANPSPDQIAARNALIHTGNYDIPFLDFAIGSEDPNNLAPISSFYDPNGFCAYHSSGSPDQGGPYLSCAFNTLAADYTLIRGFDFSNTGRGHGTDCVQLVMNAGGAASPYVSVKIVDNYFGIFVQAASGRNYCFNLSSGTGLGGIVTYKSSGSAGFPKLEFDNNTFYGNWYNRPSNTTGQPSAITDNRTGSSGPRRWEIILRYNYIYAWQGISVIAQSGGDMTFIGNAIVDICRGPPDHKVSVHCEVEENTAANVTRSDTYERNLGWIMPKPVCPGGRSDPNGGTPTDGTCGLVQWTTFFYETSGAVDNATITTDSMYENVLISNDAQCANAPDYATYPSTAGYGPNNACTGGQHTVGHGIFSTNGASGIGTLNWRGNVYDNTGSFACISDPGLVSSTGFAAEVTNPGTTYRVTSASSNYAVPSTGVSGASNINIGNFIYDPARTPGWTDTLVTAIAPTGSNTYGNAMPAPPGGTGTLTMANPQPAIASKSAWNFYTGIQTVNDANSSYAIGSGTAKLIRINPLPWDDGGGGTSNPDGHQKCP